MVSCRVSSRPNLSACGQGVNGWPFKTDMMYWAAATAAVANAREKTSCLRAIMAAAHRRALGYRSQVWSTEWTVGEFVFEVWMRASAAMMAKPVRAPLSRAICLSRVPARLQFSDDVLKHPTHSLRRGCIDRSGVDEEIESCAVLADDLRGGLVSSSTPSTA